MSALTSKQEGSRISGDKCILARLIEVPKPIHYQQMVLRPKAMRNNEVESHIGEDELVFENKDESLTLRLLKLQKRLKHRNICKVIDFEVQERPY